ncbi:hypothetical protein NDU88_007409 [Pleurodeles waltl]|uniref:Uncharacterized protein n=1 Tax=Pleurodeles waltl TaxID=8319 RepID=A0AAV7RQ84_PLEWA|nr:hypothetical protein NDU88_007409 [Pleurodeles waltl]
MVVTSGGGARENGSGARRSDADALLPAPRGLIVYSTELKNIETTQLPCIFHFSCHYSAVIAFYIRNSGMSQQVNTDYTQLSLKVSLLDNILHLVVNIQIIQALMSFYHRTKST